MDEQAACTEGTIVVGVDGSPPSEAARRWATALGERTGQPVRAVRVEDAAPAEALVRATEEHGVALLVIGSRGLGPVGRRVLGSVGRHCVRHSARPVVVVRDEPVSVPARILVGIDGTPHSQRALRWAIDLALALDAEIVAVHAVGSEAVAAASTHLRPRFHHEWCKPLRDAGVRHREVFAGAGPRTELLRVADGVGADLIVVGTRFQDHERRLGLGSVAAHLCEHARIPLAVVRAC